MKKKSKKLSSSIDQVKAYCVATLHGCRWIKIVRANMIRKMKQDAPKPAVLNHAVEAYCRTKVEKVVVRPPKYAIVNIPCLSEQCSPLKKLVRKCSYCHQVLEYGFDSYIYCQCGRGPAKDYKFLCKNFKTTKRLDKELQSTLNTLLETLIPIQVLNILVLGETGNDKMNWVKLFKYFSLFETIDEMRSSDLRQLDNSDINLPGNGDMKMIDKDTEECQIYRFKLSNNSIRLINTPAFRSRDDSNFENIMTSLSYMDALHGVFLFVDPSEINQGILNRYLVDKLKTYLHPNVLKNVMFCVTNTSRKMFHQEDIIQSLTSMFQEIAISQENIFYFDSKLVSHLISSKDNHILVKLREIETNFLCQLWNILHKETEKMLEYVSNLEPFLLKNFENLSQVRKRLLQLSRPLTECITTIQINQQLIKLDRKRIVGAKCSLKDLKDKRLSSRLELKLTELEFPRMVCTNINCFSIFGKGKHRQLKHTKICQPHCWISGVAYDTIGGTEILKRSNIDGSGMGAHCKMCKHFYTEHMHQFFESEQVYTQVEGQTWQKFANRKSSISIEDLKLLKDKMIKEQELCLSEENQALQTLLSIGAKLAHFLRQTAVTPFNDDILGFMKYHISQNHTRNFISGARDNIDLRWQMQLSLASYETFCKMYERKSNIEVIGFREFDLSLIISLVDILFLIPKYGELIRTAVHAVEACHSNACLAQEILIDDTYPQSNVKHIQDML